MSAVKTALSKWQYFSGHVSHKGIAWGSEFSTEVIEA